MKKTNVISRKNLPSRNPLLLTVVVILLYKVNGWPSSYFEIMVLGIIAFFLLLTWIAYISSLFTEDDVDLFSIMEALDIFKQDKNTGRRQITFDDILSAKRQMEILTNPEAGKKLYFGFNGWRSVRHLSKLYPHWTDEELKNADKWTGFIGNRNGLDCYLTK